jgi:hypothetical protein
MISNCNAKIEEAAAEQIIIPDMKTRAQEIRLAASKECHPDFDDATPGEAHQSLVFALALAQTFSSYLRTFIRGFDKVRVKFAPASNSSVARIRYIDSSPVRRSQYCHICLTQSYRQAFCPQGIE